MMKRSTLSLTLAALLLTLAVSAMAQPDAPRARRGGERPWRGKHSPREMTEAFRLYKMTEYLALTEEQTAKLFPRMAATRKAHEEGMDKVRDKMKELRQLVKTEKWSEGAKLAEEIHALRGEQMRKHHEAMNDLMRLLTDEQRAKFALFEQRFQGHLQQVGERMHARAPRAPGAPGRPGICDEDGPHGHGSPGGPGGPNWDDEGEDGPGDSPGDDD
jgi:Spy/CpxP family protein refolding chaperone